MKKIAASKNSNDMKLWNSIWTEAKAQGMSKDDKLAVQIPEILCPKGKDVIKELEFSVAEIEDIANHLNKRHSPFVGVSGASRTLFGKRSTK